MTTRVLPSVLLSEGHCPAGHGALERRNEEGWLDVGGYCEQCGLNYAIRVGVIDPSYRYVDVSVFESGSYRGQSYSLEQFDRVTWPDLVSVWVQLSNRCR